jgi:NADH:ubiquinone oxidoreductase subunit 6 (subunit J)
MIFTRFINSTLLLVTGALVTFAANPVNSAVFLIGAFVSAAILLFFLGVDFLSLVFIVIYVGAIAVLFCYCLRYVNQQTTYSSALTKFLFVGFSSIVVMREIANFTRQVRFLSKPLQLGLKLFY